MFKQNVILTGTAGGQKKQKPYLATGIPRLVPQKNISNREGRQESRRGRVAGEVESWKELRELFITKTKAELGETLGLVRAHQVGAYKEVILLASHWAEGGEFIPLNNPPRSPSNPIIAAEGWSTGGDAINVAPSLEKLILVAGCGQE